MDYYVLDRDEGGDDDYHKCTELSTATCAAKIHGANPACVRAYPDSANRWKCCLCGEGSSNTNFTAAFFLDQSAQEIRQAIFDTIKRFKQT